MEQEIAQFVLQFLQIVTLDGFCDLAMLFVRCGNGGISHHPDETMTMADAELSTKVLLDFLVSYKPD